MSDQEPIVVNLDEGDELKLHLELGDDPDSLPALERLLSQLVQAAGGRAGILTTVEGGGSKTASYGIPDQDTRALAPVMEQALKDLSEKGACACEISIEGTEALTVPVRKGDRAVGLFCLLHGSETPSLLRESPGIYHLVADKVEVVIQNARLLQRLLNERRWLEAVVHHSSDGVVILDQNGTVIGYNLTMSRLTGWEIGVAVGRPSHEVFPLRLEQSGAASTTALLRISRRFFHESTEPVEAQLETREGEQLHVEVVGAPLFDESGRPLGWVMTVRDITRRKEVERLQKVFLSAVSHELHTPIAVIKGFSGLLADPEMEISPAVAREKAGIIREEAERLERMVGQILYATRIQAGGIEVEREPIDLLALVRRVVQKLEPLAAAAGCELRTKLPEALPPVEADYEKIQQVLTNLIENATKYGGKSPILVQVEALADRVLVRVTDAGPGIPEADRERIFVLFERGEDPLRSRVRGAGLGLFICKAIVEAHGGRIGVEEGESGGASFYFTLPAEL
ncbi:MAG: PAS domain S-box protein [Armatimonadetes bacterium]|nr:PAS domain S-box protein [Armatimonadota bacterium]